MDSKLIAEYARRHDNGESLQSLVNEYNKKYWSPELRAKPYSKGFIQRRIRVYKSGRDFNIPTALVVVRRENIKTDKSEFTAKLETLIENNRFIRVMHMNDLHLPYHDERAVDLFLRLAELFNPHVIVMGSDAFDNPTLSKYPSDKDIAVDDWLVRTEEYWYPIVDSVNTAVPGALKCFIPGNHDQRSFDEIGRSSMPITGYRKFNEIVTYGGVHYLGKNEQVKIGALTVIHGTRFNKHAGASTDMDFMGHPVNAGHTHRPQLFHNTVINGALCQLIQFYNDKGYPGLHQHGTSLITVDMVSDTVVQVPYLFAEAGNQLWTVFQGEVLMSDPIEYARDGRREIAA